MSDVYENIKLRREMLGMTQSQLAERLGYASKGSICRIEKGKVDLSLNTLGKIADVLGMTTLELMRYHDNTINVFHYPEISNRDITVELDDAITHPSLFELLLELSVAGEEEIEYYLQLLQVVRMHAAKKDKKST